MVITSFYLLNMFPQMRTLLSSPNNQHPTPRQNMFPRMRTSSSANIQPPVLNTQTKYLLLDEHFIISQHSSPNNQAKHVPLDAHLASSANIHHPTTKQNMFPQMRSLLPLENYFHEKKYLFM